MRSVYEIWEAALGELQVQISKSNYDTWLKDTAGVAFDGKRFTIGVPNAFVGEWLKNRLHSLIAKTLVNIVGASVEVVFSVHEPKPVLVYNPTTQPDGGTSQLVSSPFCKFNLRYTFGNFVVGRCNRMAFSAALGITESMPIGYNPLFIYAGTGLGKTHLLHAIGHATSKCHRTCYITAEQFTNDLVRALKDGKAEDFRNKFKDTQVLLIDDVDFFSGKRQIQETFLHVFNDAYTNNTQIVLTGDNQPKAIPQLTNKLRSRFGSGLEVKILPPDTETSFAILKTKAEEKGLPISTSVLQLLASRASGGIRELEGSLNQVVAYAQLTKAPIDSCLIDSVLADSSSVRSSESSPGLIKRAVADYFQIAAHLLEAKNKDRNTSLARQVAIYVMKEESGLSLTQIAREFGNRNHSTILYSHRKIAESLKNDPKLRSQIEEICKVLNSPGRIEPRF